MRGLWVGVLLVALSVGLVVRPAADTSLESGEDGVCSVENVALTKQDTSSLDTDVAAISKHLAAAFGKTPAEETLQGVFQLSRNGLTCFDGRDDETLLSSPGGDLGEFIVALKVLEDVSGKVLSQFDVDTLLVNVLALEQKNVFRMCTDSAAVMRLMKSAGLLIQDGVLALKNVLPNMREAVMTALKDPENTGDEHLRFMLLRPSLYQVRRDLTAMAILSFFRVMWNELAVPLSKQSHEHLSRKLDLTVFDGDHGEDAVVSILSPSDCPFFALPVPSDYDGHELRLYYPNALFVVRQQLAHVLQDQAVVLGILGPDNRALTADEFAGRMSTVADTLFTTTVDQLALVYGDRGSLAGYPRYEAAVPSGCCPDHFRSPGATPVTFESHPLPRDRPELSSMCAPGTVSFSKNERSAPDDKLRLDSFSVRQLGAHFQVMSGAPFEFVDPREWGVAAVDSRNMESVLSVPGASLGQFALVLAMLEHQFKTTLKDEEVMSVLTNYVLAMKAPSFTYTVDVDTLYAVCGSHPICPDQTVPLEEKLSRLSRIFSKPSSTLQESLLASLASEDGRYLGDAFLRFVVAEEGIKRPHLDNNQLNEMEKRVLKFVKEVLLAKGDEEGPSKWKLTQTEWTTLKGLFGSFKDLSVRGSAPPPLRQRQRVHQSLQECLRVNRPLVAKIEDGSADAEAVFSACRDVLRRTAVYVLAEDGDTAVDQGGIEAKRLRYKAMIPRVIVAFFKLLWGQPGSLYQPYAQGIAAKMDLVVIEGRHAGHAFVHVKLDQGCNVRFVPLLTSYHEGSASSVWVYHEDAAKLYRRDIVHFSQKFLPQFASKGEELLGACSDFQEEMVNRFVSQDLYDHPVYDMLFSEGCCPVGVM